MHCQRTWVALFWVAVWIVGSGVACAQIDPEKRQLIEIGYDQPINGYGPIAGYAYYYLNQPNFVCSNLVLRLAVAPVYVDGELGRQSALGPNTDFGIGLAGGGFADSYAELRQGNFVEDESFTGHSAEGSLNLYHRFNPERQMPLNAVLRGAVHGSFYVRDSDTASDFEMPRDRATFHVRTGLRWGGREPSLFPELAGELSAWYDGQFRTESGPYGFDHDRTVEGQSHLFWGRALLVYTFPESKQYLETSLILGTSLSADRFSAYRLGGNLPLMAEFPLVLPGYFGQEISADRFSLLTTRYFLPLDASKRWALTAFGSAAVVNYLPGTAQSGNFHSGLGGGVIYRSRSGAWQIGVGYAYGFEALRHGERGAESFSLVAQYDLEAEKRSGRQHFWRPLLNPEAWRGMFRMFGGR